MAFSTLILFQALVPLSALRFANSYTDHMVLQHGKPVSIWGFGDVGSTVSVLISSGRGANQTMVAADGTWSLQLPAVAPSMDPATVTASSGDDMVTLRDVLFGHVWACSGQSNMAFPLQNSFNATAEIAAASRFPHVRFYTVAPNVSDEPLVELLPADRYSNGGISGQAQEWLLPNAKSMPAFAAVCWHFGRHLAEELRQPVGLVSTTVGGTRIAAWSSAEAASACNVSEERHMSGTNAVSALYNAMIAPLQKTTIGGVVWYQGEDDAKAINAAKYACSFPEMIRTWREGWSYHSGSAGDFPFGFVQLSSWGNGNATAPTNATCGNDPSDNSCLVAELRYAQTANVGHVPNEKMPGTFMAIAVDLGDVRPTWLDIHPRDKSEVGRRLALGALAEAYARKDVYWTGPLASRARRVSGGVEVMFDSCGASGLLLKHEIGFDAQDADGHWAPVTIASASAETVVVVAAMATKAIRYNWYRSPCMPTDGERKCAIYARDEGLPAPPFQLAVEATLVV